MGRMDKQCILPVFGDGTTSSSRWWESLFYVFWGDGAKHACCHTCGETSPNSHLHHHPLQTCDDCGATVSVTLTQDHDSHAAVTPVLIPFFVLLNYLYPAELEQAGLCFSRKHLSFYIEALRDTWITRASGLRAPPLFNEPKIISG